MLEFVYDLANDTPEGLAKEIYASRDDLEILMTEETYNKVIDKIRRSVDQVVNTKKTGRQSVVLQPASNHAPAAVSVPSTRGVSSSSTLGGLEALVDGLEMVREVCIHTKGFGISKHTLELLQLTLIHSKREISRRKK